MYSHLITAREGPIFRLTLNRPSRRNALSRELLTELAEVQTTLRGEESLRVLVLAGAGPAFCAGHDLAEMVGRSQADYQELFQLCADLMLGFRRLPQLVLARVHGVATAAGCQLVAACDLAIASESASFATPGVKIGLFCTTPMVPLVRSIAPRAALEMLVTGKPISAARALELGLVNRVVPEEQLDATVAELSESLASVSPVVLRLGKQAFYTGLPLDEASAYQQAVAHMTENAGFQDAQEGMSAFLHKREPVWTGQ